MRASSAPVREEERAEDRIVPVVVRASDAPPDSKPRADRGAVDEATSASDDEAESYEKSYDSNDSDNWCVPPLSLSFSTAKLCARQSLCRRVREARAHVPLCVAQLALLVSRFALTTCGLAR